MVYVIITQTNNIFGVFTSKKVATEAILLHGLEGYNIEEYEFNEVRNVS